MVKNTIKMALFPVLDRLVARLSGPQIEQLLAEKAQRKGAPLFYPEYPLDSRPRWTTKAPHPQILKALDAGNDVFARQLDAFNVYAENLRRIPAEKPADPAAPYWKNGWLPALDAIAIYGFIAARKPRHYVEVGSGNSTKFARRAIKDFSLDTRLVSIDPAPRAEVEALCDRVHRTGLENVDLSLFDQLGPGDIVFVDNSHRALMNSDATVFFLEVLPRLKKGVLVGVHDIYWPVDYPEEWSARFYSEQYLLAPLILWKSGFEVALPAFHVSVFPRTELLQRLAPLWRVLPDGIERYGGGFWFHWPGDGDR